MSKIKELLRVNDEEIQIARRIYNKTEDGIQEDVNLLLEWLNKQPHLPKRIDRTRLEHILLKNKFRIEQTKIKLDNYYSFKVFYPDFVAYLDPESQLMQKVRESIVVTPMAQLLPTSQRIVFIDIVKSEAENINWLAIMQYILMFWEILLSYDYSASNVYVCNTKYLSFKHVTKLDPNLVHKWFIILQNGYSGRLSQVHYIHTPPSVNLLFNLLKRTLNTKFFEKIKLHPDFDSLHKEIPKEYLPKEAEGNLESAKDMSDKWFDEILFQKEFLKTNIEETSDETLRIGKSIYSDMFGPEGTFREINVD